MTLQVLIVDDQPLLRRVLRHCAEARREMTICEEAATGQQAVDLVVELQPDVVILDWEMPEMSGIDALPMIRESLPHAAIAMYSSMETEDAAERAVGAGADAYFQKGLHAPDAVVDFVATVADMTASRTDPPTGL